MHMRKLCFIKDHNASWLWLTFTTTWNYVSGRCRIILMAALRLRKSEADLGFTVLARWMQMMTNSLNYKPGALRIFISKDSWLWSMLLYPGSIGLVNFTKTLEAWNLMTSTSRKRPKGTCCWDWKEDTLRCQSPTEKPWNRPGIHPTLHGVN